MRRSVAIIALLGCFLSRSSGASAAKTNYDQRHAAEDLGGKPVDPLKLSAGKITVLVFVRTDCPIANRYAPEIRKLSERFRGAARFWLVYPDRTESAARIREHLSEYGLSIPALRDPGHALVERSRVSITPEAAVFDPAGELVYHGRIDNWYEDFGRSRPKPTTHELEDAIRAAATGKSPSPDHANAVGCYLTDLK